MELTFNISTIIIISLICTGIYISTQDNFVLGNIRAKTQNMIDRLFGVEKSELICKPLFNCLICESSFWSILLGLTVLFPELTFFQRLAQLPFLILCVAGLNTIITALIKNIEL